MKRKALLLLGGLFLLSGCFQVYNNEADLRAVPVTNNPYIVPDHSMSFEPNPNNPKFH